MGVDKRRQRKIIRNNETFYWCVKENDEEGNLYLIIKTDEKKLIISHKLRQKVTELNYITGEVLKDVSERNCAGRSYLVENDEFITPSIVATMIDNHFGK